MSFRVSCLSTKVRLLTISHLLHQMFKVHFTATKLHHHHIVISLPPHHVAKSVGASSLTTVPMQVSSEYHLCSVHVPYAQSSIGFVQYFANFALPLEHLHIYTLCDRHVQNEALAVTNILTYLFQNETATYLVHHHKSNPTLPQHFCFHVPTNL